MPFSREGRGGAGWGKGEKLLVFGTISELGFLDSTGFCYTFAVTYHVPMLNTNDAEKVLEQLNVFADDDVDAAAEGLNDLYMLIEMAVQGEQGGSPKLSIPTKRRLRSLTSTTTLGMFVRL